MRALLLLLLSLQAPPPCTTRCGMRGPGNCGELQRLEDAAVRVFARQVHGWSEPLICSALHGWTLQTHERTLLDKFTCGTIGWTMKADNGIPACFLGYTWIEHHTIEVTDQRWSSNALAHEMVHAIDFSTGHPVGHCRWMQRGIKPALLEITGELDTSESDCPIP